MSNFAVELDADILHAALICTSNKETRYYLKGVSIEPNARDLRVVSTDGHRLFCARVSAVVAAEPFLIPRDTLVRALKGTKAEKVMVSRVSETWTVGDINFTPIDGTFPAWGRLFPRDLPASMGAAEYNPAYLVDMVKIAVALNGRGSMPSIHPNGKGPALVTFGDRDDCVALVMPRIGDKKRGLQTLQDLVTSITTVERI